MDQESTAHETALEYGFKWFEYHAGQRTTSFHFYLIAYSGLAAAASFLLKEKLYAGVSVLGLALIFMSVLFWQLDVRNRQLVQVGEQIILQSWQVCGLGGYPNPVASSAQKQPDGLRFRQIFGLVFLLGGLAGVALFVYSIVLGSK